MQSGARLAVLASAFYPQCSQEISATVVTRRAEDPVIVQLAVQLLPWFAILNPEPTAVSRCREADPAAAATMHTLQALATSTDSADVLLKESLRLSLLTPDDVSLVSSEATCRRAAAELDRVLPSRLSVRRVYVYRVGQDFAVEDPVAFSGEYRGVAFFTSDWTYKSTLLAP
jgi:hypothetical protein